MVGDDVAEEARRGFKMKIDILTLFPDMMKPFLSESIIGRAIDKKIADINYINIRDFSKDKHKKVDDYPFGGGEGLLMQAEPICDAFASISGNPLKIYLSPKGRRVSQNIIEFLSLQSHLAFLCGHYEGVDERAIDKCIDLELSIGDFVLTGGEIACCAIIDSVVRLLDGTLSDNHADESFYKNLLEAPQYTRPREFNGLEAPEVLLSGNHQEIAKWQEEKSIEATKQKRRDLIKPEKIGIMGGSFDPIHKSHIKIAEEALKKLDRIIFIPLNKSANKTPVNSVEMRARWVMQAIADNPYFDIDMCEIMRGGITYAIDTIEYLQKKYPFAEFIYIIGDDEEKILHTWKDIDKLKELVDFMVFERDEVSSTGIRENGRDDWRA